MIAITTSLISLMGGMEQHAVDTAPWYSRYLWEILIVIFSAIAGFLGPQHLKCLLPAKPNAALNMALSGSITAALVYWCWPNTYTSEQAAQAAVMLGIAWPFTISLIFWAIGKFASEKTVDSIRNGIYVNGAGSVATVAAATVLGFRPDRRKEAAHVEEDRRANPD